MQPFLKSSYKHSLTQASANFDDTSRAIDCQLYLMEQCVDSQQDRRRTFTSLLPSNRHIDIMCSMSSTITPERAPISPMATCPQYVFAVRQDPQSSKFTCLRQRHKSQQWAVLEHNRTTSFTRQGLVAHALPDAAATTPVFQGRV